MQLANQTTVTAVLGFLFGIVAYAIALVVTIAVVPRQPENVREIVDLPWPVFAFLPTLLALMPLVVPMLAISQWRSRMYFLLSFGVAVGCCSYVGIELLRRDYIGKF